MQVGSGQAGGRSGPIRGPQSLVGGLVLIAVAALALWLTRDLPQGTLRAMGPAMLPRWLAIGIAFCGAALVVAGLLRAGHGLETVTWRGPVLVMLGVVLFGISIRGYDLGFVRVPTLGLIVAGPLAIFVGGCATPEARFRDLAILALALTAFCMVLFGDLLNLPIPLFPQWLADLYPTGWSSEARLQATAATLAAGAVLIWVAGRSRGPRSEPIDVADHSSVPGQRGRI